MIAPHVRNLIDELAGLLTPAWPTMRAQARREGPVCEGEGGSGEGGGSGGGEGGSGGEGAGGGEGGSGEGSGAGGGGGEGAGDDTITVSKKDWDGVQQQNRENAAKLKELSDAEEKRKRAQAEDEGKYKELAEEERKKREESDAKTAEREAELQAERRTNRGHRIASDLHFLDVGDEVRLLLDRNAEVLDDDAKTRKALEARAKEKPHLVRGGTQPKQGNVNGDGGGKDGADVVGPQRMARAYGAQKT